MKSSSKICTLYQKALNFSNEMRWPKQVGLMKGMRGAYKTFVTDNVSRTLATRNAQDYPGG